MSALAQMLKFQGVEVSGSDRALENPENNKIISALRQQGIKLFPQDGSYARESTPDVLVYSTAVEDDNPDFSALPNLKKVHRADMLARAIAAMTEGHTIAVSGSCGKTTVTAWLAETLFLAGKDPVMIGGGLANSFINAQAAGNFKPGKGDFTVFEADESDKSLLQFFPDYTLILNIGTDHYPKPELKEMFIEFLHQTKKGAVVSAEVFEYLGAENFQHLQIAIFADNDTPIQAIPFWNLTDYQSGQGEFKAVLNDIINVTLPSPGRHSALNAAAIMAMGDMLGMEANETSRYLSDFKGVWRRFDYAGKTAHGTKVFDDYAHNVEKIISCIKTGREVASGKVIAVFQPHGFGPLSFMREPLFSALEENLGENDIFVLMPVYYAGGSTSFSPTSEEVFEQYTKSSKKDYRYYKSRDVAIRDLSTNTGPEDVIIIMGARDNSLADFAMSFTENLT